MHAICQQPCPVTKSVTASQRPTVTQGEPTTTTQMSTVTDGESTTTTQTSSVTDRATTLQGILTGQGLITKERVTFSGKFTPTPWYMLLQGYLPAAVRSKLKNHEEN